MRRRDFIGGMAASAAVVRSVRAQQPSRVYRIAVASPATPVAAQSETVGPPYWRAFFQRLRELGYVEGQNLSVARYSGEGRSERYPEVIREMVRSNPDAIFVTAIPPDVDPARGTVPVVTLSGDPVAYGLTTSFARPSGNITGTTASIGTEGAGKLLELLHEMVPTASRVAWLGSGGNSPETPAVAAAAEKLNVHFVGPPLESPFNEAEYRRVFAAEAQSGAEAMVVASQAENVTNVRLIVQLAEQARLPAIYAYPDFAGIGALIAYGLDVSDMFRHTAEQVAQILKGAKPADIPFFQPTRFRLSINLKTAKALGLKVPDSLLVQADEVIE